MEIKNTEVFGFKAAFRGMRNPKNSWHLSDSTETIIGPNDLKLAQALIKAGSEHMKFMRQIQVWADFDMTRFFWSEMDTYSFNTKNSCSTMHKLLNPKNKITIDMFDYHLYDEDIMRIIIKRLNEIRTQFLNTDNYLEQSELKRRAKCLLPEGFLQMRTMNTNYAEIRNIVLQRRNHQLKEDWQETFCAWATTLPYAKELIFYDLENDYDRLKEML